MDKEKFDDAIWDLFMMETTHRTNGNPIQADRVKNIRVKLKEAVEHSMHPTPLTVCGMRVEIANWLNPGQWFIRPSRRG